MKLNHEAYLQQVLKSKKLELEGLRVDRRVAIAKFDTREEMLKSQIDSLEKQLEN